MKHGLQKRPTRAVTMLAMLVPMLACSSGGEESRDAATDSAAPPLDGAGWPGDARTDEPDQRDGTVPPAVDADTQRDASARDAGVPGPDAQVSLRSSVCGDATSFGSPLPTAGQRTAPPIASGFGFVEGPVWIASRGVLLFSDMDFRGGNSVVAPAQIRQLTPPGTAGSFVAMSGSNGLALTLDGRILAATHDVQSLSVFDATSGARATLDITYQGKKFQAPNDLTVRSDGTVYFSDPRWQLGPRTSEIGKSGLYRVKLDGVAAMTAQLVDDDLDNPNGVALSPDEQTLYVGSAGDEVWKYALASDGSVAGTRSLFATPGASDGMTVDCAGNLYVTSTTVQVFAPSGQKLGDIALSSAGGGQEAPSNVAFGGADRRTLYITAASSLYAITLNVPGYPY